MQREKEEHNPITKAPIQSENESEKKNNTKTTTKTSMNTTIADRFMTILQNDDCR